MVKLDQILREVFAVGEAKGRGELASETLTVELAKEAIADWISRNM